MSQFMAFFVVFMSISGCKTIKAYEKEYLLNPAMDDGQLGRLQNGLLESSHGRFEKLGGGATTSGATSCPTCGG